MNNITNINDVEEWLLEDVACIESSISMFHNKLPSINGDLSVPALHWASNHLEMSLAELISIVGKVNEMISKREDHDRG